MCVDHNKVLGHPLPKQSYLSPWTPAVLRASQLSLTRLRWVGVGWVLRCWVGGGLWTVQEGGLGNVKSAVGWELQTSVRVGWVVYCACLDLVNAHVALNEKVHSAVQLDFIQCPFPNQIQFGLEKLRPKITYDFPNQFHLGLERKKMILQDADSKPNSDWFGKFWWPLSMSWKFQNKFSLVWKNH